LSAALPALGFTRRCRLLVRIRGVQWVSWRPRLPARRARRSRGPTFFKRRRRHGAASDDVNHLFDITDAFVREAGTSMHFVS
jgi:hypothetical protein